MSAAYRMGLMQYGSVSTPPGRGRGNLERLQVRDHAGARIPPMSHQNGRVILKDGLAGYPEDDASVRYETPSQFVQGTMFKLDRMKRHLRVLREIRQEYPSATTTLDQHMGTALDHVVRSLDRNVIETIKAGLRDLNEI